MGEIDTSTAAIERLMDGVTPGPWELRGRQTVGIGVNTVAKCGWKNGRKDAPFIAAARDLVPTLAAERDTLRAEVERLRGILLAAVDAWDTHNESGDMMQGRWVGDARSALKGGANG